MDLPFICKYQPLYLKDFEIDQGTFMILKTLINMDNLNILFIGDSGSGKTSLINAIIREYYQDASYADNILYINSLKEQGIQYYRTEVKTFCQTTSSVMNKKKFIVLDDIDIINEQSQQVFRNCIDKYSHNVHFIASCSNIQKVIDSLQSRKIIIKLKPIKRVNLQKIANKIKKIENISITPEAEEILLNICNNSVRILINYLEKFKILGREVDLNLTNKVCTNISFATFDEYTTQACLLKDRVNSINILYDLYNKGYSVMDILDNYFLFIKSTTIIDEKKKYAVITLLCKYITIFHNIHEDEIELALFTNNLIQLFS